PGSETCSHVVKRSWLTFWTVQPRRGATSSLGGTMLLGLRMLACASGLLFSIPSFSQTIDVVVSERFIPRTNEIFARSQAHLKGLGIDVEFRIRQLKTEAVRHIVEKRDWQLLVLDLGAISVASADSPYQKMSAIAMPFAVASTA